MKNPSILQLNNPALLNKAMQLKSTGKVAISQNQLTYLKIHDEWIHELFPLLQNEQIRKPDYFGNESIGAHISIIYPEENTTINPKELDQEHRFKIKNIIKANLELKKYYAIIVEASSLVRLRKAYGLPENLYFKGYSIHFHITVGVEY
ncbi:TPA: hypothetical protein ACK8Z3_002482 [Legionella pneumophila]|uniref:Swiss Army Knife 2H phosphoesterase domain-containing protein n=1 Tax=Legionella pneumophila subsp. pneumophila TaxID=91891 RepID=A0A3A6W233_LEGPN|nr:hypothetical protein [Legionella pneumophila]ERH44348.1 hypothetical protein N751_13530 [Legionella pneumophila str. Leg01/11]ERH45959.1 hypothetical protein N750_05625 [Legionella pneumophila str. Leg01/53]ERI48080.1 hypothetical protein N749_11050 [Legionella pneumophila str. Leg01/20]AMQ27062.1 hypothetical protein lpt_03315 [Legionella pneumophila subsp. pneumophila]AMV13333.1 hypothetical protein ULM_06470 [Legionella pneumophila]